MRIACPHLFPLVAAGALTAAIAGCDGPGDDLEPAVTAEQVAPDQAAMNPADAGTQVEGVTRYRCNPGWSVSIEGDVARVAAADGRVIELPVAQRSPPVFRGEAMEFSLDEDGGTLSRDEDGPMACDRG